MEIKNELGGRVTVRVVPNTSHALPAEKLLETAKAITDWADNLPNRPRCRRLIAQLVRQ